MLRQAQQPQLDKLIIWIELNSKLKSHVDLIFSLRPLRKTIVPLRLNRILML